MVICTIAAHNYVPKAIFMAMGVRLHEPHARLVLCVAERTLPVAADTEGVFDAVMLASDLREGDFDRFAFRHTVIECATAIKARLLRRLMADYPAEAVFMYLDPDIAVYGPFLEARRSLERAAILATPHHLSDIPTPSMLAVLKHGTFNLGFLGLRRSSEAARFLEWWDQKLESFCYVDLPRGLFVDQKWFDVAMGMFPITVLSEPGYNVGYWNCATRPIAFQEAAATVCGRPLRFVHFSHADLGRDMRFFRRWLPRGNEPIYQLRRDYLAAVAALRAQVLTADAWTYDLYRSGERIAHEARLSCRLQPALLEESGDPFARSNEYFLSQEVGV